MTTWPGTHSDNPAQLLSTVSKVKEVASSSFSISVRKTSRRVFLRQLLRVETTGYMELEMS